MTMRSDPSDAGDLAGYEVIVCVCGGIAAYKVCEVVSRLVQRGSSAIVAMTKAARRFIGPVTFQALTGRRVLTSLWTPDDAHAVRHVDLTERADLMLIAPATADMIGKIAGGIADDLVSTMAAGAPPAVVLAPAMNERMWANPIVQGNVAKLTGLGYRFVGPGEGWLACRGVGPGRMAEPAEILETVTAILKARPPRRSRLPPTTLP